MERGKLLRKIPADYTIIDLETTGINPKLNHILEVGCIKFRNHKEIERYLYLLNLKNGYIQELGSHEEEYVPNFDLSE